jgi:tetratricopeptide (TPR) repeat protein/tRNA A-37 threonylcarbamoyl transferase component Bud32
VKIGPYEVLGQLGHGGMGVVFRVRAPDGRERALKLLQRVDAGAVARFARERRLLASFGEEQGFVPLLDAGTAPEGAFFVMPLMTGGTLRQRLDKGALGLDATISLGLALARALGLAHERGVVHRDVKPENVLFGAPGESRPLLADLGLAKHFDRGAPGASASVALSTSGVVRGTAGYMSPEQATDSKGVGPPADVYALGAVLYECLAGRPALHGSSVLEVLARAASGVVEPIGRPEVPASLEAAVMKALAKDPARRFSDGARFEQALRRPVRPRRVVAPLLLGAGLSAVALIALAAWVVAREPVPGAPPGGLPAAPAAPLVTPRTPSAPPGVRAAAEQALEAAKEKFLRQDFDGSIVECGKAIALDPGWALPWAKRGHVRGMRGDLDGAIADLTKAIELDPSDALAWVDRSCARGNRRDVDGSIADATRATELDPRNAAAWSNRAGALLKKGNNDDAAWRDIERALELDPADAHALSYRGLIRGDRGDNEGEIEDHTRAIELEPRLADAWKRRGHARAVRHDWDGVEADCTRAIELDPSLAPAWNDRGSARASKEDWEGALADFRKAIEIDPRLAGAFYNLGSTCYGRGRGAEAIVALERYLELAPRGPEAADARRMLENARARVR